MARTWKQIEAAREKRLWFTQVVAPGLIIAGGLLTHEPTRKKIKEGLKYAMIGVQKTFTKIFKKDSSES